MTDENFKASSQTDSDDDIFAAEIPEGSALAGNWIIYSTSARGGFGDTAAVIVDKKLEDVLDVNPWCGEDLKDDEDFAATGLQLIKVLDTIPWSVGEVSSWEIAPGETFIDFYNDETGETIAGVYLGDPTDFIANIEVNYEDGVSREDELEDNESEDEDD